MNVLVETINHAAETWWPQLWHATWQASLVAVAAIIAVRLGRRWRAQLRYAVLLIALIKFATPPMLAMPTGLFSHFGPTVTNRTDPSATTSRTAGDAGGPEAAAAVYDAGLSDITWRGWVMLVHIAGIAAVSLWGLGQLTRITVLARHGRTVTNGPLYHQMNRLARRMGLHRRVRLMVTTDPIAPMAFGVFRPTVLLPVAVLAGLSKAQARAVLAHELAHHRRNDLYMNWLQLALATVWWFNPLIWVLNRAIRRAREDCCDDLLLARGVTRDETYCQTLLCVARNLSGRALLGGASGFAERFSPLGGRILRIMSPDTCRSAGLSWGMAPALLLAALVLPGLRSVTLASPDGVSVSPADRPQAVAPQAYATPTPTDRPLPAAPAGRSRVPGDVHSPSPPASTTTFWPSEPAWAGSGQWPGSPMDGPNVTSETTGITWPAHVAGRPSQSAPSLADRPAPGNDPAGLEALWPNRADTPAPGTGSPAELWRHGDTSLSAFGDSGSSARLGAAVDAQPSARQTVESDDGQAPSPTVGPTPAPTNGGEEPPSTGMTSAPSAFEVDPAHLLKLIPADDLLPLGLDLQGNTDDAAGWMSMTDSVDALGSSSDVALVTNGLAQCYSADTIHVAYITGAVSLSGRSTFASSVVADFDSSVLLDESIEPSIEYLRREGDVYFFRIDGAVRTYQYDGSTLQPAPSYSPLPEPTSALLLGLGALALLRRPRRR